MQNARDIFPRVTKQITQQLLKQCEFEATGCILLTLS